MNTPSFISFENYNLIPPPYSPPDNKLDCFSDTQLYSNTIIIEQQQQQQPSIIIEQPFIIPSMSTDNASPMATRDLSPMVTKNAFTMETRNIAIPVVPSQFDMYSPTYNTVPVPVFHQYSKEKYENTNSKSTNEIRRQIHIKSEQKRRAQIKNGFDILKENLPCNNKNMSKSLILKHTIQHLQHLKNNEIFILSELKRLDQENGKLKLSLQP